MTEIKKERKKERKKEIKKERMKERKKEWKKKEKKRKKKERKREREREDSSPIKFNLLIFQFTVQTLLSCRLLSKNLKIKIYIKR